MGRPLLKPTAFHQARTLLARGIPQAWVARAVGVSEKTVTAWRRRIGMSAVTGDRGRTRRINAVVRAVQRLSRADRAELARVLDQHRHVRGVVPA